MKEREGGGAGGEGEEHFLQKDGQVQRCSALDAPEST